MKKTNISFLLFLMACCNSLFAHTGPVTKKSVVAIAEKVAGWQLANLPVKDWWDRPFDYQYGQYQNKFFWGINGGPHPEPIDRSQTPAIAPET